MALVITEALVRKLLATVDAGLTAGLGVPKPGKMCVEAAIAYTLGESHSDGPTCVHPVVRAGKIALNDCAWSSDAARASGMRRVAIAQLGSTDIDYVRYVHLLAQYTQDEIVPLAAEYAAKYAEYAAESAAKCAAESAAESDRDAVLRLSADLMVRALKECGSPGCEWLWLCDEEAPCDTTTR